MHKLFEEYFLLSEQLTEVRKKERQLSAQLDQIEKVIIEKRPPSPPGLSVRYQFSFTPTVKDWDKLYEFVIQFHLPYLLERRISKSTYFDLAATREIPGVEVIEKQTVSIKLCKN